MLLGSGIPLFYEMNRQVDLELIDCKTLKTGCVLVTYIVKHEAEKKTGAARKTPRGKKARKS